MGLGEHNAEEMDSKENIFETLTNKNENAPCLLKKGILQKLRSIKVRLVPFLMIAIIILAISIPVVAVVAYKSGEISTVVQEKIIYRYAECEDDWIKYRGKCYYFSKEHRTWNESQNFCQLHNSFLAIIDNKEELDLLNVLKGSENHWIGLSRIKDVSGWFWSNGTPYTETIFKIESLERESGVLEHAFLNHNGVKSEHGRQVKKWFCNKKLALPPVE